MSEWQPIETAPRNVRVLVWRKNEPGYERRRMDVDIYRAGVWWKSRRNMQPTHWQPLPEPPQ